MLHVTNKWVIVSSLKHIESPKGDPLLLRFSFIATLFRFFH